MKAVENKRNHKRLQFLKKMGITMVVPIFLMIVGATMILIPFWNVVADGMLIGSVIFYQPEFEITKTEFSINNKMVYRPDYGDQFATLQIPNLSLEHPVIHGDGQAQLRQGIGHYVGSTLPGEGGNFVVSGHRETVFFPLQDIKIGDEVLVETEYGTYTYVVSDIYITTPDDITPTMPTEDEVLTMYTCYPFIKWGPTPERYIVVSDLVSVK